MNGVIVFDTTEEFCRKEGAPEEELDEYKTNALPVLCHYENRDRLKIVSYWYFKFGSSVTVSL